MAKALVWKLTKVPGGTPQWQLGERDNAWKP
jgi:hypothetical protein